MTPVALPKQTVNDSFGGVSPLLSNALIGLVALWKSWRARHLKHMHGS